MPIMLSYLALSPLSINVELCLIRFIGDDNYWRMIGKALYQLEPVFDLVLFLALAGVDDKNVDTALSQKELMGGMHNFLTAEIPDVQGNVLLVWGGSQEVTLIPSVLFSFSSYEF